MKTKYALFAAALACTAAFATQDAATILWKPKAGNIVKYKLDIAPEVPGMQIQVLLTLTRKIQEIKSDGKIVLKETAGDMKFLMDGQEQPGGPEMGPMTTVYTYMANGELFEKKSEGENPMDNPRFDEALVFIYPDKAMKVGDTWKRSRAGDAAKGTVDSETVFKYEGSETVGKWKAHKVSFQFKELKGASPITSSGTVWLDSADGEAVKGDFRTTNVEFQPGQPMNASAKLTRIE